MLTAPCAVTGASDKIRIGKFCSFDWIDQCADANAPSRPAHLVARDHCANRESVERHRCARRGLAEGCFGATRRETQRRERSAHPPRRERYYRRAAALGCARDSKRRRMGERAGSLAEIENGQAKASRLEHELGRFDDRGLPARERASRDSRHPRTRRRHRYPQHPAKLHAGRGHALRIETARGVEPCGDLATMRG